jgi:hypothetical protein
MPTQSSSATAAGTVYWKNDRERVRNAVVEAQSQTDPRDVRFARTNEDGDFAFEDPPLPAATWTFTAFHEDGFAQEKRDIAHPQDSASLQFDLPRKMGEADQKWGLGFIIVLGAVLAVLVIAYIGLHSRFPDPGRPESAALLILVDQARAEAGQVEDPGKSQKLAASLVKAAALWESVKTADLQGLPEKDIAFISDTLAEGGKSILGQTKTEALASLEALGSLLKGIRVMSYFWNQAPARYLEVIFWALAGVLVNLILTCGSYLRWKHFYREGIYLHVAQIVTVPFLALIFVFLASLVKINLTLVGTAQATLDLSDPRVLVALSFIIGSRPWALWEFVQERAATVTGRTPDRTRSNP